jgi:hypothetical protein
MPSLQVQLDAKSQPLVRLIANPPLAALLLGTEKIGGLCYAISLGFMEKHRETYSTYDTYIYNS